MFNTAQRLGTRAAVLKRTGGLSASR